jgi:hypothetical protein
MPAHVPLFNSAPASAVIDQNYGLMLSWTPAADPVTGLFTAYDHWDITTQVVPNPPITAKFNAPGAPAFAGGAQTYTQLLAPGTVTLTMQAWADALETTFLTNPWQTNGSNVARQFPDALLPADVIFSLTSVLLNQPLTVTLNTAYAVQVGNAATQWQVIWPDGTTTGWLPLANNVATKQFTTPGTANVTVQTRASYAASQYNPISTLIRQFVQQIFVVNAQSPSSSSSSSNLTGSLGIGGQQGFEIVGTTGTNVTPEPWEVIARCIVRDTVTNELKLLVATTRFSNASSLFGTMAADVFPMEGRPHAKELIQPPYELTTTSQTETVPVAIGTSSLPAFIVGKSVAQAFGGVITMATSGTSGIAPFIWSSAGLPDGLTLDGSGVINGTPLELGLFSVTFTVQDSSVPFSIAEVTLQLTVETDLLVEIAANQKDANNFTLPQLGTSLGTAQVNTPYSVLMQVGNINPSVPSPGGLPPYTWSIPAGALPVGLSINPSTGLISGSPSTYNSTTDFNTIFSATVQVTDAIGARATQTYTMLLKPAALTLGNLDQPTIYASQQFKLVVPIFGGKSPYVFNPLTDFLVPAGDVPYYGPPALVDGQIEVDVNFPETATGSHTFQVTVHDSTTPIPAATTKQFTVNVQNEISDPFFIPAFVDYVWQGPLDVFKPSPVAITGNLAGFALGGLNVGLNQVALAAGGTTVYTDAGVVCSFGGGAGNAYVSNIFIVSGFRNPANNGTFRCTASTASTLTLNNPGGVPEVLPHPALVLTAAAPVTGSQASPVEPFAPATVYTGTIIGGAGNALVGQQFVVAGFIAHPVQNNGTFYCVESTATTLTLSNPAGLAETHAATATQAAAKALLVPTQSTTNGITVAVDPLIPEVEFSGPPSGVFGNSQFAVPAFLQLNGITQATVSQTYTLLATNTSSPFFPTDIGAMAQSTRPYLFGAGLNELVGLNPRKPFYNSPDVKAISAYTGPDTPWIAVVASGSSLPPGLSLDSVTGLIYGNIVGPFSGTSTIQYVGTSGILHGTASIAWIAFGSGFQLIDNIADGINIGTPYPATSRITVPAAVAPSSASVAFGRLPLGLVLSGTPTGQDFLITGTAVEAGYFDVWFQVISTSGQSSYLHHRFSIDFLAPLTILTTSLPDISNLFYGPFAVQGFGGVTNSLGQYQWSLGTLPPGAAGLVINSATGQISGTLSSPPGSPTLFAIPVTVTDFRTPTPATTTANVNIQYNNALRITTAALTGIATVVPLANDPLGSGDYSFQMQAAGGTPPYQWEISPAANIPVGITPVNGTSWNGAFVLQTSGGGLFGGTYTGAFPLTFPINVVLKDTINTNAPVLFDVVTGLYILSIDASGVGTILRGVSYQGTLSAAGICTQPPVQWQVAPTPQWPNTLPAGLTLNVNGAGITATISGTYSGVTLTNYRVRIIAVDSVGNTGVVLISLSTGTDLNIAGWDTVPTSGGTLSFPLPNAFIATPGGWAFNGAYSGAIQLVATGGVAPYGPWSVGVSTPCGQPLTFYGLALNTSNGQLTNTAAISFSNQTFTFTVTDSIGNTFSRALTLSSQASGLVITTASIGPFTAGVAYTNANEPAGLPLAATLGVPPYTFSVSPNNPPANALPTGLTLSSTGFITGTSILGGYSKPVTFRVTDNIGSYSDKILTVTVTAVLVLKSGIDVQDSTATNDLGFVDGGNVSSINPRPNLSFFVIATGVTSSSPAQITVTTSSPSIVGTVTNLNTVTQTATIQLTGPFANGVNGNYPLSVTVVDSGVTRTQVFNWTVFDDGTLSLSPSSGALPQQALA